MKKRLIALFLAGTMILQSTVWAQAEELLAVDVTEENTAEENVDLENLTEEEELGAVELPEDDTEAVSEFTVDETETTEADCSTWDDEAFGEEDEEEIIIDHAEFEEAQTGSDAALAADYIASGTCGANVTWAIDGSYTLQIMGTGSMYEYTYDTEDDFTNVPWVDYAEDIRKVNIADGVTTVSSGGFWCCNELEEAVIGNGVTVIGDDAFFMCESLEKVTVGNSVTKVGISAFDNCSSLTEIIFPDTLISIGDYAFDACADLEKISFGNSLQSIGEGAFTCCDSLTVLEFPASLSSIGDYAFDSCLELTGIHFYGDVPEIGEDAFLENNITVYYPAGNESWEDLIAGDPSFGAESLVFEAEGISWELAEGVLTVHGWIKDQEEFKSASDAPWYKERTDVEIIVIEESVEKVGNYAFAGCTGAEAIWFEGDGVSIGTKAFQNVDAAAFYGWDNIWFTDTMQDYGGSICWIRWQLVGNELTISSDGVMKDFPTSMQIVPWQEKISSVESIVIDDELTSLGANVFAGYINLKEAEIPESITAIGEKAFANCTALESMMFLGSVPTFGANVFQNNVMDVYCDGSDDSWTEAVMQQYGGEEVTWHAWLWELKNSGNDMTLRIYGKGAVEDFEEGNDPPWYGKRDTIEKIVIESGITEIGKWVFCDCSKVTKVEMADSVEVLASYAFADCGSIEEIELGSGVNIMGDYVFSNCEELTSVFFTGSAPKLSAKTFASVSAKHGITVVYYPKGNTTWTNVITSEYGGNVGWATWDLSKKPYLPTRDGWGFHNYALDEKISFDLNALAYNSDDWTTWINWFGNSTSASAGSGGLCAGMSLSSLMTYMGRTPVTWWKTDGSRPSDFTKEDKNIYSSVIGLTLDVYIRVMFMRQDLIRDCFGFENHYTTVNSNATYTSFVEAVDFFAETQTNPVVIYFLGLHMVVPYRTEKTDSYVRVFVYDSNEPNDNNAYFDLEKDSSGNYTGWKYQVSGWNWDQSNTKLLYTDDLSRGLFSLFEVNAEAESLYPVGAATVLTSAEEFEVTDEAGNVISYADGTLSGEVGSDWIPTPSIDNPNINGYKGFVISQGQKVILSNTGSTEAVFVYADAQSDFTVTAGVGAILSVAQQADGSYAVEAVPGSNGTVTITYTTASGASVTKLSGTTGSKVLLNAVSGETDLTVSGFSAVEVTTTENGETTVKTMGNLSENKVYSFSSCQHSYVTETVKKATCIQQGITRQKCSKCNAVKQGTEKNIGYGSHDFTNAKWTVSSAATISDPRKETRTCTICKKKTETRTVGTALKPTIQVNATTIPLKVKQSTTALKVTGLANGDKIVSWKSNNKKIVDVDSNGKITAKNKTGKATITITLKSTLTKTITVKVQKTAVKTKSVKEVPKTLSLTVGKTYELKPVISPITSKQKVTYKTSNKKIATVNSKGVITAKKKGKVTITVKSGSKSAKCKVTIK